MSWISALAVYFVLWWITLFVVLPFSLRTQDDAGDVVLGTTSSAPAGRHVLRAMLRATLLSALLFGTVVGLADWFDVGLNDLARAMPGPS